MHERFDQCVCCVLCGLGYATFLNTLFSVMRLCFRGFLNRRATQGAVTCHRGLPLKWCFHLMLYSPRELTRAEIRLVMRRGTAGSSPNTRRAVLALGTTTIYDLKMKGFQAPSHSCCSSTSPHPVSGPSFGDGFPPRPSSCRSRRQTEQ